MDKKISNVVDVNIEVIDSETKQFIIVATAKIPNCPNPVARLSPFYYSVEPANGVYEYDLVANIPDDIVSNEADSVLVTAIAIISLPRANFKGVRVYGGKNKVDVRVPTLVEPSTQKSDEFEIINVKTKNDKLVFSVKYTGNCVDHDFELLWSGAYKKSLPPQVEMKLIHNSNGDLCEGLMRSELQFDLLDLNPCVIKISSDFGYSASLPFKLEAPHPESLIPFGPGGIPIIDETVLQLFVSLVQDKTLLDKFRADPEGVMLAAGMSIEQIASWIKSAGVSNGFGGILSKLRAK